MTLLISPPFVPVLSELEAVCSKLVKQISLAELAHAEYLALNLKCLAEHENNDGLANEAKRLAHFLHGCVADLPQDKNDFVVTLAAHRNLLRQRASQATTPVAPTEPSQPRLRQGLVLLAPESFQVGPLPSQLQWFGYEVHQVNDVNALFALPRPEALLVFNRFDGADLPLLSRLKVLCAGPLAGVPLIFLCPQPNFEIQLAALRVGAAAVLTWPVGREEIVEVLEHARREQDAAPWRMMLLCDSQTTQPPFQESLKKHGAELLVLHDPALLMNRMISFKPEMVLIEEQLAECTGLEVVKLIRQQASLAPVPVLLLCHDRQQAAWLAETAPAAIDGTLCKPVAIETLLQALDSRIQRYRNSQLRWMTDLLTGLPTRAALASVFQVERERAHEHGESLSVALIELDKMKQLNELYGHGTGDRILRAAARFLKASLPRGRWVGRYSGGRFVALLPNASPAISGRRLDDVRDAYSRVIHPHASQPIYQTCTIAVVEASSIEPLEGLLVRLEAALHRARQAGGNCVEVDILSTPR